MSLRRLAPVIALALVAACQPLPQPFADDRPPPHAPILTLKDSAGVLVRVVEGAPPAAAERIAEGMADALRKAEIPANTAEGNRKSYQLAAAATERPAGPGRTAIELRWELRDDTGRPVGRDVERSVVDAASWTSGSPELVEGLVRPAVPKIAALVQDEAPTAASVGSGPVVVVREVAGAPGDGSTALRRAMNAALRQQRVALASGPASGKEYIIAGRVDLAKPLQGQQKVTISWAVQTPEGAEIGQVNQENAVPVGSLDGAWGDVAYLIATAAADGVVALLEKGKALPGPRS
jgi:hypothetical protein